jgi:hypothetical protein
MVSLLAWFIGSVYQRYRRQGTSRVPIWSWGSLDGQVSFGDITEEDAVLLSTSQVPAKQNGAILLDCKIIPRQRQEDLKGLYTRNFDSYEDNKLDK